MKIKYALVVFSAIFGAITCTMISDAAEDIPRAEHPRPDFCRNQWMNLNGEWNFAFDSQAAGEQKEWYKPEKSSWPMKIVVPYPWESKLSGIERTDYKGTAWYSREFTVPPEWENKNIFVVFGAVDWFAKVWVNGKYIGQHEGGYTPFSLNITDAVRPGSNHVITVKVIDETNPEHPVGKQIGWYTTTSGIWQTVYLEARGNKNSNYIKQIKTKTTIDGRVEINAITNDSQAAGFQRLEIFPDDPPDHYGISETVHPSWACFHQIGFKSVINVPEPKLWSPDNPALYFVKVNLVEGNKVLDTVHTYFGIRSVERKKYNDNPFEYIFLNDKPFYILSALNQAFHPDGIYTYPSDDAIRQDMEDTKQFGFNNLRLHIKVDEPRFYYWADRLGVTILYDLPCFRKYTEQAKRTFDLTMHEALQRDFNHPSILAWVLFNETWGLENQKTEEGQNWVKEKVREAKAIDDTRLVEDNSPCRYDHILTDINSWHFYIYPHQRARDHIEHVVNETFLGSEFNYISGYKQATEPLMNSEYGGVSAGMGDRDISWCFHYLTQELRRHEKVCGYIYTELQDIEWEHNGFMNYDRSKKVFGYEEFVPIPENQPPFTYRDLNTMDFLVLDAMAGENISGQTQKEVPVALSLYSGHPGGDMKIQWQLHEMTSLNLDWNLIDSGNSQCIAEPYSVNKAKSIYFNVEPERLYMLFAYAADKANELVARNFWVFHSFDKNPYDVVKKAKWYVPWAPSDYETKEGDIEEREIENPDVLSLLDNASVTYNVQIPKKIDLSKIKNITFTCELAACAGIERVDWKQRIRAVSTPQTDVENRFPSSIDVLVNGELIHEITLANDPADYRGILSNIFELAPPSSYGYLQEIPIPVNIVQDNRQVEIELKTHEDTRGGLRVFGARSGRYPTAPTLIIDES